MYIWSCFIFGQRSPAESRKFLDRDMPPAEKWRSSLSEVNGGTATCTIGNAVTSRQYNERRFGKSGSMKGGLKTVISELSSRAPSELEKPSMNRTRWA